MESMRQIYGRDLAIPTTSTKPCGDYALRVVSQHTFVRFNRPHSRFWLKRGGISIARAVSIAAIYVGRTDREREPMTPDGQLLPELPPSKTVSSVETDRATKVVFTRDHAVIRRWAATRQAEPATGEATQSGPATVNINDGGAGIRFNFPAAGVFRPITWDEWLSHFDSHQCVFVYDNESDAPLSSRYRIVNADDWEAFLQTHNRV